MTTRLAETIARLAQVLPIKQVAAWFGVGWDTVKQIDRRAFAAQLGAAEDHLDGMQQIAIDEFAIRRGHQDATVVLELQRKRVVWIARGRDLEALRGFFTALGPTRCAAIEARAVDMRKPYAAEIRMHCLHAKLVCDLFHIVAKYALEVIDRVRVDETNRLAKAARPGPVRAARRVIKGARRLLLCNKRALRTRGERVRLRELLRANRALFIVYVLREDLKRLWQYRSPAAARRFWQEWRRRALRSRIPALRKFTAMLERHLDGILSRCRYPINSGVLEGCNNKIKVLKRVAHSFRDEAYFFLKSAQHFPEFPDDPKQQRDPALVRGGHGEAMGLRGKRWALHGKTPRRCPGGFLAVFLRSPDGVPAVSRPSIVASWPMARWLIVTLHAGGVSTTPIWGRPAPYAAPQPLPSRHRLSW